MRFQCPACSETLQVPDAATGILGLCNKCGAQLMSPAGRGQPALLVSRTPAPPSPAVPAYTPPAVDPADQPVDTTLGEASLVARAVALIADSLVVGTVYAFTEPFWAVLLSPVTSATDGVLFLSWIFRDLSPVLIASLYGAAMEASPANATLGKMMTGCVVVDYAGEGLGFGKALWRNLVKYASLALTCGLAALYIFVSRTERTLHDSAANTYVIEKHAP